jgi:HK97 family phage major capsid protein
VTDDPIEAAINAGMQRAMEGFGKGLDTVISQALKQFADAQTRSRKNGAPLIFGEDGQGDPRGKTFGDWLLGVARNDRAYLEKHYGSVFNEWQTKAALAESSGATGGYTVPPEFYQNLLTIIVEENYIRPRAFVVPMGSATLLLPYLDVTTVQSAGTTPLLGGLTLNWTAEAQTRIETEPQFKQMELKAWELSGYTVSSNVLLQDSVMGLERFLLMLFGKGIAWYEEYAFLQGSGAGKPQGMLSAKATIAVNRLNGNQIGFMDIAKMWAALLPVSWGKAIWTFSPSVVPQLLNLKDAAGRAIFISIDQGAAKAPNWTILGRPAFPTEKVPALGTRGDLALIDPSFYVLGDRQQVEVAASEHVNFLRNQMTWRVVERVDGQPWLDQPVTLQDGATQVSPFVVLN